MLAPHELKNKSFSKIVRGYNPAEVNEYIEFIIEKYTEIYRENNELERKLRIVAAKLEEIKDEEESIRSTLLKAQKMGEQIISDASNRADNITASIKDRCDSIIADFKEQTKEEKDEMWRIRTFVLDFKKRLFDTYREHIQSLQSISVNDIEEIVLPDEDKLAENILGEVKKAIQEEIDKKEPAQEKIIPDQSAFVKTQTTENVKIEIDKTVTEKKVSANSSEDAFIKALEDTAK
ncbi:MAG: hypothetical protein A2Y17_07865 [Clostridiales bacterium GWF2_38_85]|nr:MAG: hypothetical protein A2Y17_07865 [Clostridiales bacterium GWF2_38_85]